MPPLVLAGLWTRRRTADAHHGRCVLLIELFSWRLEFCFWSGSFGILVADLMSGASGPSTGANAPTWSLLPRMAGLETGLSRSFANPVALRCAVLLGRLTSTAGAHRFSWKPPLGQVHLRAPPS